jgi:hypothetical protein
MVFINDGGFFLMAESGVEAVENGDFTNDFRENWQI